MSSYTFLGRNTNAASANSIAITTLAAVAAGDLVIMRGTQGSTVVNPPGMTVTDPGGNTWQKAIDFADGTGDYNCIWFTIATVGYASGSTITRSWTTPTTFRSMDCVVVPAASLPYPAGSILDTAGMNSGSAGTGTAMVSKATTTTPSTSDWIAVAVGAYNGSSVTPQVGWTEDSDVSAVGFETQSLIGTNTTAMRATGTQVGSALWMLTMAMFKLGYAGGGSTSIGAPPADAAASAPAPTTTAAVPTTVASAAAAAPAPTPRMAVPAPVAAATAAAPAPTASAAVPAPVASATAAAPVPGSSAAVPAPVASASASAPVPAGSSGVPATPAQAIASAPSPTTSAAVPAGTAALATASAPAPGFTIDMPGVVSISAPPASAVASMPTPGFTSSSSVTVPPATATASMPVPTTTSDTTTPVGSEYVRYLLSVHQHDLRARERVFLLSMLRGSRTAYMSLFWRWRPLIPDIPTPDSETLDDDLEEIARRRLVPDQDARATLEMQWAALRRSPSGDYGEFANEDPQLGNWGNW